jgi:RNA-directed DNA polymerase
MNYAIKDFLKTRLHLETSEEKSNVLNLKKNSSEFLGFSVRAVRKGKTRMGYVAQSNMTKRAKSNAFIKIKEAIKAIQKKPCIETVWHYNTVVMGIQNYYAAATQITNNLSKLTSYLGMTLYNRLKNLRTEAKFSDMTITLQKRYKGYEPKFYKIREMVFVPIYAQRHKTNLCFSQDICNYTANGRAKIHKNLKAINKNVLSYVMKNFIPNRTIEYSDNRISRFIAQYGRCAVSGVELGFNDWHCHHKNPYHLSKDDSYSNLIVLQEGVHRLVHLKDIDKIKSLLNVLQLNNKQKEKLNELRKQCKNDTI